MGMNTQDLARAVNALETAAVQAGAQDGPAGDELDYLSKDDLRLIVRGFDYLHSRLEELLNPSVEMLEVARKAIEDELIEFRDARIFTPRNNGLVIKEADGTPSHIIRFGPEAAVRIGLRAILSQHAAEGKEEGRG